MDPAKKAVLDYIDLRANAMRERLISWCNINSGTLNLPGSMGSPLNPIALK